MKWLVDFGPLLSLRRRTKPALLRPIAAVSSQACFHRALPALQLVNQEPAWRQRLCGRSVRKFCVRGYCAACARDTRFRIDRKSGSQDFPDGTWIPNWRERLECRRCRLNNRQRLVSTLLEAVLLEQNDSRLAIYFMEQVTPMFRWAKRRFCGRNIVGSEFVGAAFAGGAVINGIRHEDVTRLSFPDASFGVIVSTDVMEHVPDPVRAFQECARTLVAGGTLLATFPFFLDREHSATRARLVDGKLEHLLDPVFHGNPMSSDGSLVFTDFGWDVVESLRLAGFATASVEYYCDHERGHIGLQPVFRAVKPLA
jgi:hypothetical protein